MKVIGAVIGFVAGFIAWQIVGNVFEGGKAGWNIFVWIILGPASALMTFGVVYAIFCYLEQKEAAERAREQAHIETEKTQSDEAIALSELRKDVDDAISSISPILDMAALHAANAAAELADESVGQFWDEIEGALRQLANYRNCLDVASYNSSEFRSRRLALPPSKQPAELESRHVPSAETVIDQVHRLVRQARRNPSWEQIYQQRRTNDILVQGFQNLGSALDGIETAISTGLQGLATSFHSSMTDIMSDHSSQMLEQLEHLDTGIRDESSERRDFERLIKRRSEQAIKTLEHIQYGRRHR